MLHSLVGVIEQSEIDRLVQLALPEFRQLYGELIKQLDNDACKQAVETAHALKYTAGLFSCGSLMEVLEKIENMNQSLADKASFSQELEEAFQLCIRKANQSL